jgi:hypothetical protein
MITKKEIEFQIDKNGNISIDVKNINGPECLSETRDLEKKLGEIISRDKKPEYYKKTQVKSKYYQKTG